MDKRRIPDEFSLPHGIRNSVQVGCEHLSKGSHLMGYRQWRFHGGAQWETSFFHTKAESRQTKRPRKQDISLTVPKLGVSESRNCSRMLKQLSCRFLKEEISIPLHVTIERSDRRSNTNQCQRFGFAYAMGEWTQIWFGKESDLISHS